jgi:hypothetical protein
VQTEQYAGSAVYNLTDRAPELDQIVIS